MPFGLDLKSLAVGVLLAWFVIPYITAFFHKQSKPAAAAVA